MIVIILLDLHQFDLKYEAKIQNCHLKFALFLSSTFKAFFVKTDSTGEAFNRTTTKKKIARTFFSFKLTRN